MIKKIFISIALVWFTFLMILIFREQIVEFLGQPKSEQKTVSQSPTLDVPSPPAVLPVKEPKPEPIPFSPLPELSPPPVKKSVPPKPVKEKEIKKTKDEPSIPLDQIKKPEESFGLFCTKFEKIPSRFRLASWEGLKKIELEDLSKIDSSSQKYPKFWLRLRVPYKEFIHPTSRESHFRPTTMSDPNKRIIAQSFEVKEEALAYSNKVKPIGYLILRDFKLGGPPYQITSEVDLPLTSSYYIHFEQNMGPQKFFHDLTGKRNGHKFGGWGVEYTVTKQNFAQNIITVLRKDLKTGKIQEKELQGPSSL